MKTYSGPGIINQLAHLREDYKGKNMNGGRKCLFTQSKAYKNGYCPNATSWCSSPSLSYFTPTLAKEQIR